MTLTETVLSGVLTVMGGGNIWNWLASRGKTRVDLITLAQSIAAETIRALDTRIERLEDELKEARHEIRGLSQHIISLETLLIERGITPPPRPERKARS